MLRKSQLALFLFLTISAFGTTRYLSPQGVDTGDCTNNLAPCLTLAYVDTQVAPGDVVQLHGANGGLSGFYQLTTPFSPTTSGTAGSPITYENYPGEVAIIIGTIKPSGVLPTWNTDDTAATAKCVTNTPGGGCLAYYVDLDTLSYNDFDSLFYGQAGFPAIRRPEPTTFHVVKTPNTNAAPQCVSGIIPPHTVATVADANAQCGGAAYSIGGQNYNTAGLTLPCASATPYWCGYSNLQYAPGDIDCTWHDVSNHFVKIQGYETWSANLERLGTCDTANNIAHMTGAAFPAPSGNGGFVAGHSYAVLNALEQAKAGDWYLDHHNALAAAGFVRLYIFADTVAGENPTLDTVYFPQMALNTAVQPPTGGQLIKDTAASYLTFLGGVGGGALSFVGDNFYPGANGLPEQTASPLTPGALSFSGVTNIILDTISEYHIQGWAVDFQGAATNSAVQNSAFYDIGGGVIRVGAKATPSDTAFNIPSNFTIQQNKIEAYEMYSIAGEAPGIFIGDAHDININHNSIKYGYTGCSQLGFGLNRDATGGTTAFFTYNITFDNNVCEGANGAGGNYYAVASDYGAVRPTSSLSVNCPTTGIPSLGPPNTYCIHITHNVFHDLPSNYNDGTHQGSTGVYFEQGASAVEARFNLIYRIGQSCTFQNIAGTTTGKNLPMYNLFENNICGPTGPMEQGIKGEVRLGTTSASSDFYNKNIFWFNSATGGAPQGIPGKFACFADDGVTPVDCTTRFTFTNNDWFDINRQALTFKTCTTIACTTFNSFPGTVTTPPFPWASTEDVGSISIDPHFVNPTYGVDDWHVTASLSNGFVPWDYTTAGATTNTLPITSQPRPYIRRFVNAATDYIPGFNPNPVTVWGGIAGAGTSPQFHFGKNTSTASLAVTSGNPPNGQTGTVYGPFTMTASGGSLPYTWTLNSGTIPTGLTLDAALGKLSGTPTVAATFTPVFKVTDSTPGTHQTALAPAAGSYSIIISAGIPALSITSAAPPNGFSTVAYSYTLMASGGVPPYTWSVIGGALPTGLTLNASTGAITGTPTVVATFTPTFRVTDSAGSPAHADQGPDTIIIANGAGMVENQYCLPGDVSTLSGQFDGPAALPTSCFYTARSASPSPNGVKWTATDTATMTAALSGAACGDVIQIPHGTTITAPNTGFVFNKHCSSTQWITIETDDCTVSGSMPCASSHLPPEGTRVTPCYAGVTLLPGRPAFNCTTSTNYMATITVPAIASPVALMSLNAPSFLRFIGIVFTRGTGGTAALNPMLKMNAGGAPGTHIIFDQVWGEGQATQETTRFSNIDRNSFVASVNSFYTDFHCLGSGSTCSGDSQVFSGGTNQNASDGDHALKFYNNFLEAGDENIIFGGGGAAFTPSDIEVRSNYFFKPTTWNPASSSFSGTAQHVKNHFELKNAQRVLVEGNVLQNDWAGFSQAGASFLINPKNQTSGGISVCPLCQVLNVTLRYNYGTNVAQMAQTFNGKGDPPASGYATAGNSYSYHDMLFDNMMNPEVCGALTNCGNNAVPIGLNTSTDPTGTPPSTDILHDVTINHITLVTAAVTQPGFPNGMFNTTGPTPTVQDHLIMTNLIAPGGAFGMPAPGNAGCGNGVSISNGTAWMNACWITWTFSGNAVINGHPSGKTWSWPTDSLNFFPVAYSNVGFVNYNNGSGGDYRLCTGVNLPAAPCAGASLFHNAGIDGQDVGANVTLVNQFTSGVTTF